ncbi:MAG: manganese catalase family protein, partial [Eubacteriales bacterium]|nr:manganese catalase family protein [Eubacteriales bacterium]
LAAEQKARATYEHLMNLTDDPALLNPLRFLREREIVHYQRFGECLNIVNELVGNSGLRYSRMGTFGGNTRCN